MFTTYATWHAFDFRSEEFSNSNVLSYEQSKSGPIATNYWL